MNLDPKTVYKSHDNSNLHDAYIIDFISNSDKIILNVSTFTIKGGDGVVFLINPCKLIFNNVSSVSLNSIQRKVDIEVSPINLIDMEFGSSESKEISSLETEFTYYLAKDLSGSLGEYDDYILTIICKGFSLEFDKKDAIVF